MKKSIDCLFRVCPVNRYAAQKQLWSEHRKFQLGEPVDEEMMAKLKVAADKEREQNELEYGKMLGNLVQVCYYNCILVPFADAKFAPRMLKLRFSLQG